MMHFSNLDGHQSPRNYGAIEEADNDFAREFANLHGDVNLIKTWLAKHNKDIKTFHPAKLTQYHQEISQITGTPLKNFIAGNINCFASLILYPAGSIIAQKFQGLDKTEQRVLASAPLLLGGLARITSGWLTDRGYGKETIIVIEALSIIGIACTVILLMQHEGELSTATTNTALFWQALAYNVIQGLSIGAYSAGIALTARHTRQDAAIWMNNLNEIAAITSVEIKPDLSNQFLTQFIRKSPALTLSITSAITNTAPGFGVMLPVILASIVDSPTQIYCIYAAIMFSSMIGTILLTSNMPYDQLIRKGLSPQDAEEVANYLGQATLAPAYYFKDWSAVEQKEIIDACIYYSVIYGLLVSMCTVGPDTLQANGMDASSARLLIGGMAIISSVFRGVPAISTCSLTPQQLTDLSLIMMLMTTLGIQLFPKQSVSALLLFGVFNGIGNFSVVEKISKNIPSKIGIATSLSTGIAAFLAFPIGIASLWFEYTPVLLCAIGVIYSLGSSKIISSLRASSIFPLPPASAALLEEDLELMAVTEILH